MPPIAPSLPPVRLLKLDKLDKSLFTKTIDLWAIKVESARAGDIVQTLGGGNRKKPSQAIGGYLLSYPRIRTIISDSSSASTFLTTAPSHIDGKVTKNTEVPSHKLVLLDHDSSLDEVKKLLNEVREKSLPGWALVPYQLELNYDYWNVDEIMKSILPEDVEPITSFETIGHIAHMNLREHMMPYKYIIGQLILDKNKGIKTVVNKLDTIDSTFRNFKMEILAGEPNFIATVSESNCAFTFDFSMVYWNSRLHMEHSRLHSSFAKGSLVSDVMAGVGPFAIPAAKHGSWVWSNDLNPESVKWMKENISKNGVQERVWWSNRDGRDFIRLGMKALNCSHDQPDFVSTLGPFPRLDEVLSSISSYRSSQVQKLKSKFRLRGGETDSQVREKHMKLEKAMAALEWLNTLEIKLKDRKERCGIVWMDHYIMNLPAIAIEFLDAYHGLFNQPGAKKNSIDEAEMPMVHVHCFSKADDPAAEVLHRIESYFNMKLASDSYSIYNVRKVAPKKDMMCVSFRLPKAVAFAEIPLGELPKAIGQEAEGH